MKFGNLAKAVTFSLVMGMFAANARANIIEHQRERPRSGRQPAGPELFVLDARSSAEVNSRIKDLPVRPVASAGRAFVGEIGFGLAWEKPRRGPGLLKIMMNPGPRAAGVGKGTQISFWYSARAKTKRVRIRIQGDKARELFARMRDTSRAVAMVRATASRVGAVAPSVGASARAPGNDQRVLTTSDRSYEMRCARGAGFCVSSLLLPANYVLPQGYRWIPE